VHRSFTLSREPVELRDDDRLHFPGINERKQSCHAGAVQVLGGLSAIDDNVDQLGVVDYGHRPNLLRLGLEGNASVRLLVCGNTSVAYCFHQ
jgi:hypothetical protein